MTGARTPDPSFLRGATMRRMTRRDLFRYAGVGAGSLGLASILAACGVESETSSAPPAGSGGADVEGSAEWWAALKADGPGDLVNFTNWPQYIDNVNINGVKHYPTLEKFTDKTGVDVEYRADINGNTEYYATIRPQLESGDDTGSDILVITNGSVLTEMMELGYLIPLDPTLHPNFDANASASVKDPTYDPGNNYTMAWQSGFTGIAYNKKFVDKEITSFMDLFDETYTGKIGMFGDNADLPALALLAVGVNPETSTPDDWQKAADLLIQQRDSGVVRKYYIQDYLTAFENEDLYLTMAWSGDIIIDRLYYGREEFEFVLPKEGGVIWTDNMCIPSKAANPLGAEMLMDWYYSPNIAAELTEYNNYVGPVPAAEDIIKQHAADATSAADRKLLETVARSPLVFPTEEIQNMVYHYRVLTAEEEQEWNDLFVPIYQQ
jgi:spermidine/putrescine transport system substrate-binding protein